MNVFAGDSHIRQFHIDLSGDFCVSWFSGATAKGLNNQQSNLKIGGVVRDFARFKNLENIFLMFGGVDIDFSFYKKVSENPSLSSDAFCESVTNSYLAFIKTLGLKESVCILAPHLSPLTDENFLHVTSAHSGVDATTLSDIVSSFHINHAWRNDLTIQFNNMLCNKLNDIGVEMLRIDLEMLGGGGVIDQKFIAGNDHHCIRRFTLQLWRNQLLERVPVFKQCSFD